MRSAARGLVFLLIVFAGTTSLVVNAPAQTEKPPAAASDPPPPPPDSLAKAALETSPRHGEFVDVELPGSKIKIRTWVVYPERKEKAGVVIVIQEIFGLTDWLRGVADRLAADGFIAVAPDLISGMGPGGGGTDSVASRDEVVKLTRALTPEETANRLNAVRAYTAKIPAANGKIATMGFCWGGARSFEYAAASPPINAAVVYYGSSPDSATLQKVKAPVLGLYGGDDARVNATIEPAQLELTKLERSYEPHQFAGAGHGFLRAQGGREGANLAASQQSWPMAVKFLRTNLE